MADWVSLHQISTLASIAPVALPHVVNHSIASYPSIVPQELCPRKLELPLLIKSSAFFFLFDSESRFFGVFFTRFPEEEILDDLERGPAIEAFTVQN